MTDLIRVLGHDIEVIEAPTSKLENRANGMASLQEQKIYIEKGLPEDLRNTTVIHEFLHIISDILGLDLSEEQVIGVATGLNDMGIKIEV